VPESNGSLPFLTLGNTVLPVKTLTFKVSDDEARQIRLLARKQRLSLSEYLRRRARGEDSAPRPPKLVSCQHTGALVFCPVDEGEPLTSGDVRDLLSDFP